FGNSVVTVGDIGQAKDASQIQTNIVRVDGQPSIYLPILKQGGDSNTIAIVDGVKKITSDLVDVPKELITKVVFDQSIFVKNAIHNLIDEGLIGLVLTALMILMFLGSVAATVGVLALSFSRLIDNSVVVLENIYRHLEQGETPAVAAEIGGREVALPVLAA